MSQNVPSPARDGARQGISAELNCPASTESPSKTQPNPSRPTTAIVVGERHRRELGDIDGLARSIAQVGLLHAIVVTPDGKLVAGERRLRAAQRLGWTEIPVNVVDLDAIVRGEYAENTFRKELTLSESVAIARALEPLEKAAAKERMREGARRGGKGRASLPTPDKGRAGDKTARATGLTRRTLEKAEAIVDAAEAEPEKFGKLLADMDRTGRANGVFRRLNAIKHHGVRADMHPFDLSKGCAAACSVALSRLRRRVWCCRMAWLSPETCAMPPETTSAAAILGWAARGEAIAVKSFRNDAVDWMVANGAPSRAVAIVQKAPVSPGDMNSLGGITLNTWADSARTTSAFYRILADGGFTRGVANHKIAITTIPSTGVATGEGVVLPVVPVTITNVTLTPIKTAALIAVSDLLLKDVSGPGQMALNRALLGALSNQVDATFLARLVADAGTFSVASSGATAINAKTDLRVALQNVNTTGGSSKLYWVCGVDVAKRASTLATTTGADAFVAMSPMGGELANLPCIVSSGVASSSLVLIDASGIAVDGGSAPTVSASTQASIQLNTAPDSPVTAATVMTSMFQQNMTALRCDAWFAVQPLRDDAVAVVTGIAWA